MAIPLVHVRHKVTGAKTFLPETSLDNFPDYVRTPSQKARDEIPDGTAFPAAVTADDQSADATTAATTSAPATTKKE